MLNLKKADKTNMQYPQIISFASPSITPSNNFKPGLDSTKEVNQSLILGRKIDSPQLRVGKDINDRPSTAIEDMHGNQRNINLKSEDLWGLNYVQSNQLNQTNKEIQRKQFDFSLKQPKNNVTIQYDSQPRQPSHSRKESRTKNLQNTQKKRQGSKSAPKHHPSASIGTTHQAQPLINLQFKNVKMSQPATSKPNQVSKNKQDLKFASGQTQLAGRSQGSKHRKNKSEVKGHSKVLSKSSIIQKQINMKSGKNDKNQLDGFQDGLMFSFDNKENQSINFNTKKESPRQKLQHQQDLSISSISSGGSRRGASAGRASTQGTKGGKNFMDKSSLLRQLSPDKSEPRTNKTHKAFGQMENITDFNKLKDTQKDSKSNLSTLNISMPMNLKVKQRPTTSVPDSGQQPSRIYVKGIDKIIKENLRKRKNKEEEQFLQKYLQDFRQKQKRQELSQRNQEVRKINASKILANHQHKHSQVNQVLHIQKGIYKKQRSKSCMNKTDSIFSGIVKRDKSNQHHQQYQVVQQNQLMEEKRERKREKSFVLEIKELKREIDEEIRREIMEGKLDVGSCSNKKTNLTTINAKPPKCKEMNFSMVEGGKNQKSKEDLFFQHNKQKRKSKSREGKQISQNIQKFIERKKKAEVARKSMEQTIEHEKQLKIKKNLHNLDRFVKQHFRQQSHGLILKKINGQKIQMVPQKKLKPHFFKVKKQKHTDDSKILDIQGGIHVFDKSNYDFELESHEVSPLKQLEASRLDRHDIDFSQDQLFQDRSGKKSRKNKKKPSKERLFSNFESISKDPSPQRSKAQSKKKGKRNLKIKTLGKQTESEKEIHNQLKKQDSTSDHHYQQTVIKNEIVPRVPEDRALTLIPPQSDIATLELNIDKSNIILKDLSSAERTQEKLKSTSKLNKSPNSHEYKKKISVLLNRYGGKRQGKISDTKLLIKLHSAAITIQQQIRKFLTKKGFYSPSIESQMYVDSEQDQDYNYLLKDSSYKDIEKAKGYRATKMSPLRVKNLDKQELAKEDIKKDTTKFYGQDNKDQEKVVMCSVINSERDEIDDSLQNTQKYIPLRTKPQRPKDQAAAPLPPLKLQEQLQQMNQPQRSVDLNNSDSSNRRRVPVLDLQKLNKKEEQLKKQAQEEEPKESSSRYVFERHPFQDLLSKGPKEEQFNEEMIKMREEAINYQAQAQRKYIQNMYKANQISPRTYETKKRELEKWVEVEREEVKKTKKILIEDFEKKTKKIIEQTQKDQELTKKMLDSGRLSIPSKRDHQVDTLHSQRVLSSRREGGTGLIDLIYDQDKIDHQLEEEIKKKQQEQESAERLRKQEEEKQRKQLQEEQKRKQDEENRKKQQALERELEEKRQRELEKKKADEELKKQREAVEKRRREEEEEKAKKLEIERKKKIQEDEYQRKQQKELEEIKRKQDEELQRQQEEKRKATELKEKERVEREKRNQAIQEKLDAVAARHQSKQVKSESISSYEEDSKQPSRYEDQSYQAYIDDIHNEPEIFSREDQVISSLLQQPKKGKVIEESFDDEEEEEKQLSMLKEEPSRGLSRTRSSQDLKDNKGDLSDEEFKKGDLKVDFMKKELNDQSMDEELIQQQQQNQVAHNVSPVHRQDFFTKHFDDEKADDILENLKNTTTKDLKQIIQLEDIQLPEDIGLQDEEKTADVVPPQTKSNQIYIEDKGEEIDLQKFNVPPVVEESKRQRMPSNLLSQIPVEEEQKLLPGMPVSPASQEGIDIRIVTGSQSLESTLSDERKLKLALQDANRAVAAIDEQEKERLPTDEKEDIVNEITDDIYRSIMAELKLELDLLLIKDPRRFAKEDEPIPQNYFLSESGRFLIFERKGIRTDLFAIEAYVEEVLDEVLKDKNKFLTSINTPLQKKALEILNQLQNSEIGSYEHFEVNFPSILDLNLYLKLEKRRKEARERERELGEKGNGQSHDKNFLAECEHIHNKVLFDCINDSLLQFKPYGKDGVPLPWSRLNRRLKPIEDFTIEEMFEIVKHDLFRWAIMQAGTLPRREFVFGGVFDDELFAEIREKKLATLLAREMIETEPKWLNYEFEEAQVKIDIGDMILEQLVTETITFLNQKNQAQ